MKVKVNKWKEKGRLNEIFQSLDVKFSFLTQQSEDEFTQILQPCKCRDFLLDVLWSKHTNKLAVIYGMSYNYSIHPYDEDHLKLSLTFPNKESKDNFIANVPKFLHEKEESAGLGEKTVVLETEDKQTIVVIADPKWQSSTWKLSLYTYYLKLCGYTDPNSPQPGSPEAEYKPHVTKERESVLLSHVTDEFTWFFDNISYNHNYGGFLAAVRFLDLGGGMTNQNYHHLFRGVK